jgi:three-Cys-motif partner protein
MLDDDELPLDEVGSWVKDKHERLRKYIDISRATRRKWIEGRSKSATYVDLFCGAGRAIIRDTGERTDGSPLVAYKSARDGGVPFSEVHIADQAEERCLAAKQRIHSAGGSAISYFGAAEVTSVQVAHRLNPHGLHFVFVDPYNLQDLPFSVIKAFSGLRYIDLLIHVSVHDLQRNLDVYAKSPDSPLHRFAPGWRSAVDLRQGLAATRAAVFAFWASQIEALGLPPAERAELVSGPTKNQRLYWLVFASRSDFAKGLWDKIRNVSGQRELF